MHFITEVFKGITKGKGMTKEGFLHFGNKGAAEKGSFSGLGGSSGMEQEEVLGEKILKIGDEAAAEVEREVEIEEQKEQKAEGQVAEGQEQKTEDEQEFLGTAMPIKTTGSVGNFGKHMETSKEAGSLGERLGRLASVKGEHHYFQ